MEEKRDLKEQSLLFVHEKVLNYFDAQQKAVDHIITKVQLVIVADTALVGFILNKDELSRLDKQGVFIACLSILVSIMVVWPKRYKFGPKIEDLIDTGSKETFNELVAQYNDKLRSDIKENSKLLLNLTCFQKISIVLFILAVGFLVSAIYY